MRFRDFLIELFLQSGDVRVNLWSAIEESDGKATTYVHALVSVRSSDGHIDIRIQISQRGSTRKLSLIRIKSQPVRKVVN